MIVIEDVPEDERCKNCGEDARYDYKQFPIGRICTSCFFKATGASIKCWGFTVKRPGVSDQASSTEHHGETSRHSEH